MTVQVREMSVEVYLDLSDKLKTATHADWNEIREVVPAEGRVLDTEYQLTIKLRNGETLHFSYAKKDGQDGWGYVSPPESKLLGWLLACPKGIADILWDIIRVPKDDARRRGWGEAVPSEELRRREREQEEAREKARTEGRARAPKSGDWYEATGIASRSPLLGQIFKETR